jgi:hypothetical protein
MSKLKVTKATMNGVPVKIVEWKGENYGRN